MNLDIDKSPFVKISDVVIPDVFFNRLVTGNDNLDLIFGSGILPGSTITLKALPGVGKSVFALTLAELLVAKGYSVAYSSGEEDIRQIAYNCRRLNVQNVEVGTITDVDELLEVLPNKDFVVIDSFQSLTTEGDLTRQKLVKYCTENLVKQAKVHDCALMFIVQETASGEIRGGTTLPYAVDVNMQILKKKEDKLIRVFDVYKNRFGATMMHEASFGERGYEFLGEYVEPDDMKDGTKKESVKDTRKAEILEMREPPLITVNRVMEHLGVKEHTAKLLLSELESTMKIIKYGRGPSAIWKLHDIV